MKKNLFSSHKAAAKTRSPRAVSMLLSFALIITALISPLSFTGCSEQFADYNIYAMDTIINIHIPKGSYDETAVMSGGEELVLNYEKLLSRTMPESDISRFNQSEGGITDASDAAVEIVKSALEMSEVTNGSFDVTLGAVTELWDFDAETPSVPDSADIENALLHTGYTGITVDGSSILKTDPELKLDLGSIAKGYVCGKLVDYLKAQGVSYGMVSFGGNAAVFGSKPSGNAWTVGLRDPRGESADDVSGYVKIDEGYVSVSGDYERCFILENVRYHHILNAKTGYPVNNEVYSVSVIAKDPMLADALSTALFTLGYDEGMELYRSGKYVFEAVFVTSRGIFMTDNIGTSFWQNNVK